MRNERVDRLSHIRSFLRLRRCVPLAVAASAIGLLTVAFGAIEAATPSIDGGGSVQLWRLLGMGAGIVPALALYSPQEALEKAATLPLRRMEHWVLFTLFAWSAVFFSAAVALVLPSFAVLIALRALPAWFGIALVSGRILGWKLSWVLSTSAACVLVYWGESSGSFAWWEFTARHPGDVPSAMLSLALFAIGLVSYSMTPWRIARLIRR